MINYESAVGPFAHNQNSSVRIMYTVIATLIPAILFGIYQFGLGSLTVIISCMVAAILTEWVCLAIMHKKVIACMDGSSALTGLLLAMSMPSTMPAWMCVFGSAFAVIVGKQIYGGLGQNLFNPAMLARVMLIVCFPVEMTKWATPTPIDFSNNLVNVADGWLHFDGLTSATALSSERTDPIMLANIFFGQQAGCLGETSSVLILLGGLYLIYKGIIHWAIPLTFFLGLLVPAAIAHVINPQDTLPVLVHLLSGGAMLGAFYIATDLVTSPTSVKGQMVYGVGCGFLVWLIRSFGSYPEGVAFAVLIMNSASPLIDHYLRPSIFGSHSVPEK